MKFGCSLQGGPNFSHIVGVKHCVVRKIPFPNGTVSGFGCNNFGYTTFVIIVTKCFAYDSLSVSSLSKRFSKDFDWAGSEKNLFGKTELSSTQSMLTEYL